MSNQLKRNETEYYRTWDFLEFAGTMGSSFAVTSGVLTKVLWGGLTGDQTYMRLNSGTFTFLKGALYTLDLSIVWGFNTTSIREAYFLVNGNPEVLNRDKVNAATSGQSTHAISFTREFNADDTIEVWVSQLSGGNLDVVGTVSSPTAFSILEIKMLQSTS